MRAFFGISATLVLGAACWAFVGCDNSSVPAAISVGGDDGGSDGSDTVDFDGAAKGGSPARDDAGSQPIEPIGDDAGPLVIDKTCCNLTIPLDDPTHDEAVAISTRSARSRPAQRRTRRRGCRSSAVDVCS